MRRVRAKVCGITQCEDAVMAVRAGADAIGMILHASSPRQIDIDAAKRIRDVVSPMVTVIGVVVDAPVTLAQKLYQEIGLNLLQLHGQESAEYATELNLPYIRAIRARSVAQVEKEINEHSAAQGFLLDPYVKGQHGGTGQTLSADLWPNASLSTRPLILAGGLGPENLAAAIAQCQPYAVDLNSGVERAPGIKSERKLRDAFSVLAQHTKA